MLLSTVGGCARNVAINACLYVSAYRRLLHGERAGGGGRRKTLCYALGTDFEMSSFLEMNSLGVRVKLLNGSIPVDN